MKPAIEFTDVHKTYGRAGRSSPALDGVTFAVAPGEFAVLTGPSGAGKTTLIKLLMAIERPDRGEIRVVGRDVHRLTTASVPYLRRNLGVVFQDFRLLPEATATENVRLALQILGLRPREVRRRASAALERVGLDRSSHRKRVRALSGGEQQRVALARAIASDPPILLGDEPTGNLDPELSASIIEVLSELAREGTTLLIATHDPAMQRLAPHAKALRLTQGRLTQVDSPRSRLRGAAELIGVEAVA
ncbi:MAG: ATP-binding cassette domain-containing protein [Myxococcales bacterium FL481]|nr:MAG: ATP-binding cassette domain-containing protein [Myxococcales bacterium FL481]